MTKFNEIDAARVFAKVDEILCQAGLRVDALDSFEDVREVLDDCGKPYLTPFSDPLQNDMTRGNALWLVARGDDGVAMVGCARLEDLGGESVGDYWRRIFARAYGGSGAGPVCEVSDAIARNVRGRLVYFGDLFVAPKMRGGRAALRAFVALGHLMVRARWDPDYTYCFIRERDVLRGGAALYGFNWLIPRPFNWDSPPAPRCNSEWAAFLGRDDLPSMVRAASQEFSCKN